MSSAVRLAQAMLDELQELCEADVPMLEEQIETAESEDMRDAARLALKRMTVILALIEGYNARGRTILDQSERIGDLATRLADALAAVETYRREVARN